MSRRCFVISPIGAPDSEVREHADDVFDYIVRPAMEEVGIAVYRADHDRNVGRITDQMFHSILNDTLCIAILTFANPNVYYELAVAHSAARPVIILNLKGNPLPFDLKDLRVIEYTLRHRLLTEGVYVRQIVEMVRHLEEKKWAVSVPFGTGLAPLGAASKEFMYRDRLESFGSTDRWIEHFEAAERAVDISGLGMKYWTKMSGFRSLIQRKTECGCRFRFLVMHPSNPALTQYFNPDVSRWTSGILEEMESSAAYYRNLAAKNPNVAVRQMRVGCHHQQIMRIDDTIFAAMLLYSESTRRSPLIECNSQSSLFRIMQEEFDALWAANPDPIDLSPTTDAVEPP